MKKDTINKLIAVSAITSIMLTATGCSMQEAKEVIEEFNPINDTVYIAYGPVETEYTPTDNLD